MRKWNAILAYTDPSGAKREIGLFVTSLSYPLDTNVSSSKTRTATVTYQVTGAMQRSITVDGVVPSGTEHARLAAYIRHWQMHQASVSNGKALPVVLKIVGDVKAVILPRRQYKVLLGDFSFEEAVGRPLVEYSLAMTMVEGECESYSTDMADRVGGYVWEWRSGIVEPPTSADVVDKGDDAYAPSKGGYGGRVIR